MFKQNIKYFKSSIVVTFIGLLLGGAVGYYYHGTAYAFAEALVLCAILAVLEISISFDNAVVNATVLQEMTPLWRHRFMTWGMLIAVFGMRMVFPLLIVGIVAGLNPWEAFHLAAFQPDQYAQIMQSVHHQVAAFGGAFLLLVALKYFFDFEKEEHWLHFIEAPLAKLGKLEAIEVGFTLLVLLVLSKYIQATESFSFLCSGIAGVLTFLAVEAVSVFLQNPEKGANQIEHDIHRASLGMFLYLEVLDASFSFDGVVGAFAISNNLFIISIGLGIGAMFVRSLTILMVEKGSLQAYRYLEHGAFYAVASLAIIMFLNTIWHIPEMVTGLIGALFIGMSIWSSQKVRSGNVK